MIWFLQSRNHIVDSKSIAHLDSLNLLHVYDVLLDLEEEFSIAPARGPVTIRLWDQAIRFRDLHPGDDAGIRDEYCQRRWKILNYLKGEGVTFSDLMLCTPWSRRPWKVKLVWLSLPMISAFCTS
jgi:hypothetical protein